MVVESEHFADVCHVVLARFITAGALSIQTSKDKNTVDRDNQPIVLLFIFAADKASAPFG
jgi:hypothetical protein